MQYLSTRGGVTPIPFAQAVMMGLATDGGLLLPESIPQVEAATLRRWAGLPFQELAWAVMRPYIGPEISDADLSRLIHASYSSFTHPEITPVVWVGEQPILELFHGPTLAFKDVALQFLGNLFAYLLEREGGELNILGATSGDTGSAAIYGVRGKGRIRIFILHPHQRVSPIQERQMTTVLDANVHNMAIRGTFDDGQAIVKELFSDLEFKQRYHLGAVNSINWARILAQVVYYFYAWGRVTGGDPERTVRFSVPTGNFGDIFAGYVAQRMGLPVRGLILATNRNDILSRFIRTGCYETDLVHPTYSPSMDIQISSNFERYLYHLLDGDPAAVRTAMEEFHQKGKMTVSTEKLTEVQRTFMGISVSEEETLGQIRESQAEYGYLLDPHTAVGVRAARDFPGTICLATAHPAKFGEAVRLATGKEPELPPPLADLLQRPVRCAVVNAASKAVREYMIATLG